MRNINKYLLLSLIFPASIFVSCKDKVDPDKPISHNTQPKFVKEGELTFKKSDSSAVVKINIEIADNDEERQMGLMNRSFMNNNQGMLFTFDVEEPQAFWMKNTIIPLDIIYVNAKKEIVSISRDTEPFSEKSLPSGRPAIYVVEVNAGFCDQYEINPGCRIDFKRAAM